MQTEAFQMTNFDKHCGLKRAHMQEPASFAPILAQLQLRSLKWAEMEISLLQHKNVTNKVAANRVRVFVALKRGLHGGRGAHVLLGYETQKLCIWIISSAQRGSSLRPPS